VAAAPPATPFTNQFTPVFVVPVTVAENEAVWLTMTDVSVGATVIPTVLVDPPPPFTLDKPLQPAHHAAIINKMGIGLFTRIMPPGNNPPFQASMRTLDEWKC